MPPVLDLDSGHEPVEGRVVVISATRTVRDRGWAPRAAVEMARGWASQGARVFLADLSLEDPEIHSVLEAGNLEGVSDSLLYGASIQRVARPADDGAFFVATAGTAVADPSLVLGPSSLDRDDPRLHDRRRHIGALSTLGHAGVRFDARARDAQDPARATRRGARRAG